MLTLVDRNTTTTTTTTINTTLTESKFSLILVHIVCAETRVLLDEAFESSKPITIEVEDHPVSSILPPSSQVASSASASAAHDDVDISKLSLSERIVEVTEEEEKLIKEAAVQAAATSTSSSPSSLSEEQVIEGDSSDDTQAPLNIPSNAFTKNESRWKHMLPVCLELVDAIVSFLTELDPTTLFEDKSTSPSSRESLSKSLLNIQNILTETFKALTLFIDDRYSTYKLHLTTYTVKPLQGNGTNEMSGVTVNVMGDEAEGYSRYLDEPCFILALRSFSTWFAEESLMDENGAEDTGHSNNFSGTGGSKRDARFMPGVEDGHDSFGESAARIKALIEICCLVCQKG